eukprot:9485611-Pyramimonas_sp.AAC.1
MRIVRGTLHRGSVCLYACAAQECPSAPAVARPRQGRPVLGVGIRGRVLGVCGVHRGRIQHLQCS